MKSKNTNFKEQKSWFLEKINKISKFLAKLTKKEKNIKI
jgi:hypothetical protein